MTGERGIALILAILVMSFLSAIGLGLALIVMMDRLATGNLRASVALLYAADAAIELTARELMTIEDWDLALSGDVRSAFVDGTPDGARQLPGGGTLDLTVATNALNCGTTTGCTPAQMERVTRDRPWGANNARWRLFAHGPFAALGPMQQPAACYLAVWVADDRHEEDGDPLADNVDPSAPGHGTLRIRAEAYGVMGSRRSLEAELARRCRAPAAEECLMGIRVQSWKEVRNTVP